MISNRRNLKLCPKRPGSSSRRSEFENSSYDYSENKSKIPRLPRRTSSFEGKVSIVSHGKFGTKKRASAVSMIPRPGIKPQAGLTNHKSPSFLQNYPFMIGQPLEAHKTTEPTIKKTISKEHTSTLEFPKQVKKPATDDIQISVPFILPPKSDVSLSSLETKVRDDFNTFKNGVLKIPEYWSDAGETVSNILRNAIQIITKQYPSSDIHLFEQDIQRVLKDTEMVKQQILLRIENIINKADNLYNEKTDQPIGAEGQELKMITKRMENLKNEVNIRKNVFGDLLKYGSEMKGLLEVENLLKQKALQREENANTLGSNKVDGLKKDMKWMERMKCKQDKKTMKVMVRSCGDSEGQKNPSGTDWKPTDEKTTQTLTSWIKELNSREKELKELTESIRDIYKLCRENILKFKNINFQIKMKEYSNKSRGEVIYRDIQVLKDSEENDEETINIPCHGEDIDVVLNDKNIDGKGKTKVLRQQKKLLQIRNELLGMLKNKCTLEDGM